MPDILDLEVKPSLDENPICIVNIYNAPTGSDRTGKSAETMIGTPELLHKRSLIMGDTTCSIPIGTTALSNLLLQ